MKILKFLDEKLEVSICAVLIAIMTAIIFVQVIMRYVLGNSLSWSEELARYIFIWLIYLGISYGAKQMKHIKIEAALVLFPKKLRPYIVILGDVIFWGFCIVIAYTGLGLVGKQFGLGQRSPAMRLPMWIVYAAPAVGFFLTSIRQIQAIWLHVKSLREEIRHG